MMNDVVKMALALDADLSNDAPHLVGSLDWNDWRNHLTIVVRACWPSLSRESRAVAFLQAHMVTGLRCHDSSHLLNVRR